VGSVRKDNDKMSNYPDFQYVNTTCLINKGARTCRYLTVSGHGWSCEKHSPMKAYLDRRAADGKMTARADNCAGKDSR
jgi:hypothetical protein